MKILVLFTLTLCSVHSSAQVKDVWLTTRMDGQHSLGGGDSTIIWGYGYDSLGVITLPAPLLEFELGDSVQLHMINDSPESHTIHLHGLDVDQINDGVPQTSFFIIGNDTGTYRFSADHAGTFLYHCHVTTTLHLTMGMYGMIVVNAPNKEIYPNGPQYHKKYEYLISDLEEATNDNPLQSFPFNEIIPDHFMVNGLAGQDLALDSSSFIYAEPGDGILVRIGSMAYSKTNVRFPMESNAILYMSDGRPIPNSQSIQDLEIYPGERYSVLLKPDTGYQGAIHVDYYNMMNGQFLSTNTIPLVSWGVGIDEHLLNPANRRLNLYPNPASSELFVDTQNRSVTFSIYDSSGRLVKQTTVENGEKRIDISELSRGFYQIRSSESMQGIFVKN